MVVASHQRIVLEALTPLHIGSGGPPLMQDFDYLVQQGHLVQVDLDRALEAALDRARALAEPRLSRLFSGPLPNSVVRRRLPLRSAGQPGQVLPLVRDPFGRPYLPGSSLKGCFRTALLWHAYQGPLASYGTLPPDRRRAAQPIEGRLLATRARADGAPSPNHDLLRALQAPDAYPSGPAPVAIERVQSVGGRPSGPEIWIEAIQPGARFELTLRWDEFLLAQPLQPLAQTLRRLRASMRAFSVAQLNHQIRFVRRTGSDPLAAGVMIVRRRIEAMTDHQFPVLLGWGTGWAAKTIGTKLSAEEFEQVASRYRFVRGQPSLAGFPTTLRAVSRPNQLLPLGWAMATVEG